MEASFLNFSMFGTFRDIDGQQVVRLYNPSTAITKGLPRRWVLGTAGRDEVTTIAAATTGVTQRVVFARENVGASSWGYFVVDGPIQTREGQNSLTSLMSVTLATGTYTAGNAIKLDTGSAAIVDAGAPYDPANTLHLGEIVATVTGTAVQIRLHARDASLDTTSKDRETHDYFRGRPAFINDAGYGDPTGATGDVNIMVTEAAHYEYEVKGAGQTLLAMAWSSSGVDIGGDQADDEGHEITLGISATSRGAFVIGTDSFYVRAKFSIADVSGTDDCAIGFRKAEAYQAGIDSYADWAVLNVISGDIKIETEVNAGGTTTTDTTDNWADAATKTLEVRVSASGAVTYTIDGVAPTVTAAFTFDSGDTVVPFFFFLNSSDLAGAVNLKEFHCGRA